MEDSECQGRHLGSESAARRRGFVQHVTISDFASLRRPPRPHCQAPSPALKASGQRRRRITEPLLHWHHDHSDGSAARQLDSESLASLRPVALARHMTGSDSDGPRCRARGTTSTRRRPAGGPARRGPGRPGPGIMILVRVQLLVRHAQVHTQAVTGTRSLYYQCWEI